MDDKTIARFWAKVDRNGPTPEHMPHLGACWIWMACRNRDGYGIHHSNLLGSRLAHRCAWELTHSPIRLRGLCAVSDGRARTADVQT